ncbi:putative sulfotransferase [Crocosphaera subtropica ATCC 51142]|uniref:Sulfotransferase n=1 Tax=Crocosphaera subtropica (strain ATCC 51142 / BH68) TaxID=43989 RepID=B1WZC3_CROS5|nr:sulfotransferase [Crocosphaera subtropica]ACB49489.1 putative sulfotransferase [Crocosphaera subtropica ATCC 51142]
MNDSDVKLPNFLIVGIQKAGTTSVYNYLKQHPQVYLSPLKETNFLEKDWPQLIEQGHQFNPKKIATFEQYKNLFEGVTNEIAIGEISPNYLFHYKTSTELIKRYVPHAKLIAILRNPVERAISDYLMHVREAQSNRSLKEQIQYRADKSFVITKGKYYQPVKYYFEQFSQEQVSIFLYDDLRKDSQKFIQDIYKTIGVNPDFEPDTSRKSQVAQVPKNKAVNNLLVRKNPIRSLSASLLKPLLSEKKRQQVRSFLIGMNSKSKEEIDSFDEEKQLLLNLYRDDILKLQDLIDRDLSPWLTI